MAILAIPNPTKKVTVNFSLAETRNAVKNVSKLDAKFVPHDFNDVMENYKFGITEFLSIGSYVDVNISEIDDKKTSIEITVSRKVGTFNKSYEVTNANTHIANMITYISTTIGKSEQEANEIIANTAVMVAEKIKAKAPSAKQKKVALYFYLILAIIGAAFYYYVNYILKK